MRDATPSPADELGTVQSNLETIADNLSYTERELPVVGIGDALRTDLESFCARLSAETRGMRASAALLGELIAAGTEQAHEDAHEMIEQLEATVRSLIEVLHQKVMAIRSISDENPESVAVSLLSVLFHESGANILTACTGMLDGLRRLKELGAEAGDVS